jgi:hypothetical protein
MIMHIECPNCHSNCELELVSDNSGTDLEIEQDYAGECRCGVVMRILVTKEADNG